jgi:signal transduction histidine kinase
MADPDLFRAAAPTPAYDASSIEVLEGLEPVRRRPGMYVGGTDERALHHLAAEVLDNAMDEAVAGHATRIEVTLAPGNRLTIVDNGRGIPAELLPKLTQKGATFGKAGGHGLGLHHARRMLESWGGGLAITSQYGRGTTVTLTLPVASRSPSREI